MWDFWKILFFLLFLCFGVENGRAFEDFACADEEFSTSTETHRNNASISGTSYTNETVTERASNLFAQFWKEKVKMDPQFATSIGVHTYNDKLTPESPCDFQKSLNMLMRYVARAHTLLPYAEKGTQTRSNLEIFIAQYNFQIGLLQVGSQYLPVSYLENPLLSLIYLVHYHPLNTSKDYRDLISRYRAFPQKVQDNIELMNVGIEKGITQPKISMKNVESKLSSNVKPAEESIFYEPFTCIPDNVPQEEKEDIQKSAKDAIDHMLSLSFLELERYLRNVYSNHTRNDISASSLPNNFYKTILNYHITVPVTPEYLHDLGLREVDRISLEMRKVIDSLGLNLTVREFNDKIRNDPAFFFTSEEEALETYRDVLLNQIQPKLAQFFKKIPEAQIQIEKVPENMIGGPQAYYLPGSGDGTSQGTFFVDTSSLKDLPKYEVVTLSLHEGLPGHHFQISYSMEEEDAPEFRKYGHSGGNTAFVEGWALYSEFLGYEMGLYNDPYMLYGHLSEEIFRACRLVVDTGIHAFGWSRQKAIDYMVEHSASTPQTVEREVDRYITWPGQACGYKFGEVKIKELREKAAEAMREKFDLKEFHDLILKSSGPLSFVEEAVDWMIEKSI